MSFNPSRWDNNIYGKLAAKGFVGAQLHKFTGAVGQGSATHSTGKAFATTDVGTIPGNGIGSGTGITVSGATATTNIFALASAAGFHGSRLYDVCDACGQAFQEEYAQASLASVDSPVFLGTGTIVVGSIAVVGAAWSSLIQSLGAGQNFIGSKWPDFAQALGTGQAMAVLSAGTGTLTIVGSPSGTPASGSGAGSGTMS